MRAVARPLMRETAGHGVMGTKEIQLYSLDPPLRSLHVQKPGPPGAPPGLRNDPIPQSGGIDERCRSHVYTGRHKVSRDVARRSQKIAIMSQKCRHVVACECSIWAQERGEVMSHPAKAFLLVHVQCCAVHSTARCDPAWHFTVKPCTWMCMRLSFVMSSACALKQSPSVINQTTS